VKRSVSTARLTEALTALTGRADGFAGKAGHAAGWTMPETAVMMRRPKSARSRESLVPFLGAGASRLIPGDGATGDQAHRIIAAP
jgi:hypothetical protein